MESSTVFVDSSKLLTIVQMMAFIIVRAYRLPAMEEYFFKFEREQMMLSIFELNSDLFIVLMMNYLNMNVVRCQIE